MRPLQTVGYVKLLEQTANIRCPVSLSVFQQRTAVFSDNGINIDPLNVLVVRGTIRPLGIETTQKASLTYFSPQSGVKSS
jgi:hypothetical protein